MPVKASSRRLTAGYWRLWLATGIDNIGNGAYIAAVLLLAVTLTQDPRLITLISTATYLPWLLVSLPAPCQRPDCQRPARFAQRPRGDLPGQGLGTKFGINGIESVRVVKPGPIKNRQMDMVIRFTREDGIVVPEGGFNITETK